MRFLAAGCVYALFTGAVAAAEPRWIRVQSSNFEIYSTGSESSTRDTLRQFEQVRAFFLSTLPTKDEKPAPVRIVAFNSLKEYEPYRLNEFASAYYHFGGDRDVIVMSHGGNENFHTAIHEYVHLVMRHAGAMAPPWLDEGLAEFYSTLHQLGGKVVIGEVIPGRLAELQREKWVPLSVIPAADRSSPYYNEKNKAGSLYNEGWALTHMLSLSPEYRTKWRQFALAILNGKDSVDALAATYGKPLEAIEEDLRYYVRGNRFPAGTFDGQLEKIDQQFSPEPAPAFDVKLVLLDLAGRIGKERETQEQLEKLSAEEPSRPEPYVQLGYIAWRRGKSAEAKEQFEKAFALGGRSTEMLWDYGRMIETSRPAEAVRVLSELTALEPARRDVRIELASALLNAGRAGDSVETIVGLGKCTPEEAVRCVSIATYAYLKLNDRGNAEDAAELYLKFAKSPDDRQRAQQVLDFLKRSPDQVINTATQQAEPPLPRDQDDPGPPRLAHRTAPVASGEVPSAAPARLASDRSVSGSFVELVCGDAVKMVLETSTGKKTLVIDDPRKIVATGRTDGAQLSWPAEAGAHTGRLQPAFDQRLRRNGARDSFRSVNPARRLRAAQAQMRGAVVCYSWHEE
jgi:tetratricopeptide (TPR) repeat protein